MAKVNNGIENEGMENEIPLTPEEERDEMRFNEREILASLMGKNDDKDVATMRIDVRKPGQDKPWFSFRIRPLTEKEYNRCREKHTRYKKNSRFGGIRIPENTDTVMYHSELIYTATVKEDRDRLWDNREFWKAADAATGTDMIEKLIPYAGVKQRIVDKIEELSGYNDDDEDDEVKN